MDESNLHRYQHGTVRHIVDHTHAGIFMEMGLGKTVSTLTAINILMFEELAIKKVLIIAPKRVAETVWRDEIEEWAHVRHLKLSRIIGKEKDRRLALHTKAHIYTIGRDNIAWLCGQFGGNMLPFDMLVVDESSSFKNHNTNRFKSIRTVLPSFDRVVILTGTPAPNTLIELWPQLYMLDRGERLGRTISAYRRGYFTPGQTNGHVVYNYNVRGDGESRIHDKIKDICMSMKAEDYLDLPERIDNKIIIEMPPEIKDKYDEFEKNMVLELFSGDEEQISAVNAAVLSNKLLQFANGCIYDEDKNSHSLHDLKLDAAEEIVKGAVGKPVLIAWTYRHDLQRLKQRLGSYNFRELKTDQDIKDWNDGKIEVLLMHPASGGHGLNLQRGGSTIVWFGQTWSLELYQQLNARLHRQGQTESVVVHHILIKGTIDMNVMKALKNKSSRQEGLMQAIKARIKKYVQRS